MTQRQVLVIDDEENMRHMISTVLKKAGYKVQSVSDGHEGILQMDQGEFDFVLCDIRMPKMDGITFLRTLKTSENQATVIMMSAYGTIDLAVEAMKLGAYDFISKPFKNDEILLTLKKAEERILLQNENNQLREKIKSLESQFTFGALVAKTHAMKSVFNLARKVAQYNTTVLILGESGTGKELVARAVHEASQRKAHPLIPVNCGGIPQNLLESELFGYVKGAFTGADHTRKGLFEEADGGTIFLDEIGELPLSLQVKLLRVLQESEIRPVGKAQSRIIDVRVIAATSRDLEQMVGDGVFREDLYYRLNVLPIQIPPLRERREDIPLLCQHFIKKLNFSLNRNVKSISPGAMSHLLQHQWPGNVRELENAIERAMVLAEGDQLKEGHFPAFHGPSKSEAGIEQLFKGFSLKHAQKIIEKELIVKALKTTDGNRTQASRLLEISHPSLLSKMKAYDIDL